MTLGRQPVSLVTSPLLQAVSSVVHGMTTRLGGVSESPYHTLNLGLHVGDREESVIENRRRVCESLGFSPDSWVSAEQVHGIDVVPVTAAERGRGGTSHATAIAGTDGMVTDEPGILLAGFFADCVPIFAVDPVGPRIGLAHAGWRGTLGNIAGRLVEALHDIYSSEPADLLVWLGPAIGPCCFAVQEDLAERFVREFPFTPVQRRSDGVFIDLRGLNRELLIRSGVTPSNIAVSDDCTMCRPERFFSHRGEGPRTGRMAGLIGIRPW